jgi:transcription initiation factor TFIID subunit 12
MGQPVIAQTQTFKLEGADSTSVLSKKKLTELVRQVTGGTETLSPEVEEVSKHLQKVPITAECEYANLLSYSS